MKKIGGNWFDDSVRENKKKMLLKSILLDFLHTFSQLIWYWNWSLAKYQSLKNAVDSFNWSYHLILYSNSYSIYSLSRFSLAQIKKKSKRKIAHEYVFALKNISRKSYTILLEIIASIWWTKFKNLKTFWWINLYYFRILCLYSVHSLVSKITRNSSI